MEQETNNFEKIAAADTLGSPAQVPNWVGTVRGRCVYQSAKLYQPSPITLNKNVSCHTNMNITLLSKQMLPRLPTPLVLVMGMGTLKIWEIWPCIWKWRIKVIIPSSLSFVNSHKYPSEWSVFRWQAKESTLGHSKPCGRTGNDRASVFHDHNLLPLAIYCITYPKATATEINAFLYKTNYGSLDFRFYSGLQITETEQRIGLTQKRDSTTTYQALLPINKQKRWIFWNLPYPYGIAEIWCQGLIDLNECGVEMSTAEQSIGRSYIDKRCKQSGLYSKSDKLNLLLAISDDDTNPMQRRDIMDRQGYDWR